MKRTLAVVLLILSAALAAVGTVIAAPVAAAQAEDDPIVRGVLFWLDTCPHCHIVIDEVLPPLQARYGDQLDITLVEVSTPANADMFYAVGAAHGLSPEGMGVPILLVGDHLLSGSQQIPAELPGLIDAYLAAGGVDIPPIPGLEGLSSAAALQTPVPTGTGISGAIPAFLVLAGLVLSLVFVAVRLAMARQKGARPVQMAWLWWSVPVLAVAGMVVAGYLTYVETQQVAAVCGPVGDCNAVQVSAYARFLGVPVGIIGLVGYVAILAAWLWGRAGNPTARAALLGMTVVGVLFSVYLTWVELFVIRAVCMWCLSSAVIMMALMLAAGAWLANAWPPPKRRLRRHAS